MAKKKAPQPDTAPAASTGAKIIPIRRPARDVHVPPSALARVDCELSRILSASPASSKAAGVPTAQEVVALLALAGTAINRWSEDPPLGMVAVVLDLLRRHLTWPDRERRLPLLEDFAERLFHALRAQGTPIGDGIEDRLGHPGTSARAGRRLAWTAERLLAIGGSDVDHVARTLAASLSDAYGAEGIIDAIPSAGMPLPQWWTEESKRVEKVARAVRKALKRHALEFGGVDTFMAALQAKPEEPTLLREDVARDVVIAAAAASGFKRAGARLFGAYRKQLQRRKRRP